MQQQSTEGRHATSSGDRRIFFSQQFGRAAYLSRRAHGGVPDLQTRMGPRGRETDTTHAMLLIKGGHAWHSLADGSTKHVADGHGTFKLCGRRLAEAQRVVDGGEAVPLHPFGGFFHLLQRRLLFVQADIVGCFQFSVHQGRKWQT